MFEAPFGAKDQVSPSSPKSAGAIIQTSTVVKTNPGRLFQMKDVNTLVNPGHAAVSLVIPPNPAESRATPNR